jgi:signal transduction histidine kinase
LNRALDPDRSRDAELRSLERQLFGARRALWLGVAAVVVALVVLVLLQYRWLTELEDSSALARRATLAKRLDVVAKEIEFYYRSSAERALNLPAQILEPSSLQKAAGWFRKKAPEEGVRRLFVVSYATEHGSPWFYEPDLFRMVEPEFSAELLAVWSATESWRVLHKKGVKLDRTELDVVQRDPAHRIIVNPITDESSRLVGLAGMILDDRFFENTLLPAALAEAIPELAEGADLEVCVRDGDGRQVLPHGDLLDRHDDRVRRSFGWVFSDWTVALQGGLAMPERWARTNFYLNMSLSVALAALLIGGLVVALRTALREVRLSAMKNEFVSNVSHELRTPLASIRVFGEFLRRGRVDDPDKVREYGRYIETESRRLTQLINNILDFSRIEAGHRVYTFEPTDVEQVVGGTLETFDVRLKNAGFELEYRGPDEPLPPVPADAAALDRALANLLDNAVKYSDDSRRLEVELRSTGDRIEIAVTDHGVGIPRDEQPRIFERFHRVSTGLVHDVKGSGLGLALVDHIMRAHDGGVTVRSEPGHGSTFTLWMPVDRPREGGTT